jgi:hypothetical protein
MTSFRLQQRWQKVRQLLSEALEIEREKIGPAQAACVTEFIELNELGLACDQLVDALSDLEFSPDAQSADLLGQARDLMA